MKLCFYDLAIGEKFSFEDDATYQEFFKISEGKAVDCIHGEEYIFLDMVSDLYERISNEK